MKIAACTLVLMVMTMLSAKSPNTGNELDEGADRHHKNCRSPWGVHGDTVIKQCIKHSCRKGVWKSSMDMNTCCFNQKAFKKNTVIEETGNTTVLCNNEARIEVKKDTCEVESTASCENDNKLLLLLKKHIEEDLETMKKTVTEIKTNMTSNTKVISDIKTDVIDIQTNVIDIETNVIDIQTNVIDIQTNVIDIQTNVTDLKTDIDTNTEGITDIKTNITDIKTDIDTYTEGITDIKTNITDIKTDIDTNTEGITEIKTNITDIKTDIDTYSTYTEGITDLKTNITELRTDIDTYTEGITDIKTNITDLRTDIDTYTEGITDITKDITNLQTDIDTHTVGITAMKTTIGNNTIALGRMQDDITPLKGYINTCAYQDSTNIKSQTITYDKLLLASSNLGGGGINTGTGLFTAPITGDYLLTYSGVAHNNAGDSAVQIYIMKNTVKIEESQHYSNYGGSSGFEYAQGGRSLILHLAKGETTRLYCQDCSTSVYHITFCVSLTTPTSG